MTGELKRGALIVFEGGDKCGKTTHCAKLLDALRKDNKKVEMIKFPARESPTGHLINKYLGEKLDFEAHAAHLLFAANRWENMPEMKKKLNDGITLIVDRYSYSGVAYSLAKQVEGMDFDWCWQSEVGLLCPDAVLLLTTKSAAAVKRPRLKSLERFEEDVSFQDRVQENYKLMRDSTWTEIDTSRDIDEVHADVKEIVKGFLKNSMPILRILKNIQVKSSP